MIFFKRGSHKKFDLPLLTRVLHSVIRNKVMMDIKKKIALINLMLLNILT